MLLLGDMLYQTDEEKSCCRQIMDAYTECGRTMVGLQEVELSQVVHYGILSGEWTDEAEQLMKVSVMTEKPAVDVAKGRLRVDRKEGRSHYYATFGQYVMTCEVFDALEKMIRQEKKSGGEYQLTDALEMVRKKAGLYGLRINGESFGLGIPEGYRKAVAEFGVSPLQRKRL